MSLANLHIQLTEKGHIQPSPERLETSTLKYYLDRLNHSKGWQALGAELGILDQSHSTRSTLRN